MSPQPWEPLWPHKSQYSRIITEYIYVCIFRLLGFTPHCITVWHWHFTGTLASTCAPPLYRNCCNYTYLCAKLFPTLDLFHNSKTGRTWYHTSKQNNCWNAEMAILFSFLPFFHSSFLSLLNLATSYHYLSSPSLLPLHITLLRCYPWNPCSLWVLENTHIHTCNCFYNYSCILLLEWSTD